VSPRQRGGAAPATPTLPTSGEPDTRLEALAGQAAECRACPLFEHATQTVFGEGPASAAVVLLGEQPGDVEDREGHPFVGPAGRVLDRALVAAGIDRDTVYVSNVVKHFKWERSGKVRLHKKPNAAEIRACRPWWEAELAVIRPRVVCCLGATAAQAVFGPKFRVTRDRGIFLDLPDRESGEDLFAAAAAGSVPDADVIATIHPSAVLRAPAERRDAEFDGLVADLSLVAERLRA
jgi:DNA polymerase